MKGKIYKYPAGTYVFKSKSQLIKEYKDVCDFDKYGKLNYIMKGSYLSNTMLNEIQCIYMPFPFNENSLRITADCRLSNGEVSTFLIDGWMLKLNGLIMDTE